MRSLTKLPFKKIVDKRTSRNCSQSTGYPMWKCFDQVACFFSKRFKHIPSQAWKIMGCPPKTCPNFAGLLMCSHRMKWASCVLNEVYPLQTNSKSPWRLTEIAPKGKDHLRTIHFQGLLLFSLPGVYSVGSYNLVDPNRWPQDCLGHPKKVQGGCRHRLQIGL